ncbi:MAG: ABC transporter ATP-binding protein [Bacteroidota bacterium]
MSTYQPLSSQSVGRTFPQLLRQLRAYLQPYRRRFVIGTIFCALSSAIWLAIPWAIGQIITESAAFEEGKSLTWVWEYLGWIALASMTYYAFQEIARFLVYLVGNQASVDLQQAALKHIIRLNLDWHEEENSGNKLKKINRGGDSLRDLFQLYINLMVDTVVSLVGIMIIFATLHWQLNALLIVFFFLQFVLGVYLTGRAKDQARRVNHTEEEFEGIKFEVLNNIRTVKTLDMGLSLLGLVQNKTSRLIGEIRKRIILFRSRLAILGISQQLFRLLVLGFSVWQVIEGNFAVGMIAQVYFYFGKVEYTAKQISNIYHQLVLIRINLDGVCDILEEQPTVEERGEAELPLDWHLLELKEVRFAYGEKEVLKGVSGQVQRGQKIGLVGASGAGKTTLFKILQQLVEQYGGKIRLDGLAWADIRRSSFAAHLGVVLQETELFNLSIKDNIQLGLAETGSADRLQQAIFLAGMEELIERLPDGWDTLVGEKGVKLSGGERQRLGIARALYRQPAWLFLDEATSQLDAELEARIQHRLQTSLENTTAFLIAHRLSSLRETDQIWVLEAGRIVERGNLQELLDQKGLFFRLWEQQMREEQRP